MVNTAQIEKILNNFDIQLENYDVINLDEKKGWSSKFLYLIVEQDKHFILKGKHQDQLAGFMSDIVISDFLLNKGFEVRKAIKTTSGDYLYIENEIYWDMKTYIPGSVTEFIEYNDNSLRSLVDVNLGYISASLNTEELYTCNLDHIDFSNINEKITTYYIHFEIIKKLLGNKVEESINWFRFAQSEVKSIVSKNKDRSIIHNDLNHKNILVDLKSDRITYFIDWDHGGISTPLKDIIEPINMFYDFVPGKYDQMRKLYIACVLEKYDIKITKSEFDFLQVYFYALNKWNYIAFFAKLINDVGNSSNELENFENIIKSQLSKLIALGQNYKVF